MPDVINKHHQEERHTLWIARSFSLLRNAILSLVLSQKRLSFVTYHTLTVYIISPETAGL